jgi:hypothetical protein
MTLCTPRQDLDDQFYKIINGKDVAIVGPAGYLEKSNYGKSIDSKDVIVRINRSFETAEKIPEHVGSKTDIIYSCLLETSRNAGILNFDKIKSSGVKMICAPGFFRTYSDFPDGIYASHPDILDSTWDKLNKAKYGVRIAFENVDTILKKETQTRPNTGFLAIFDILACQPRSLTIHGFTFYLDGFIKGSKAGVEKEKNCTEEEFALMALNSKRHKQENMWKFAKEHLLSSNNVILDDTMKKILSLEKFSREEFNNS